MKDNQITAKEHNETMDKRRFDSYQANMELQPLKSINGRHEQCPQHGVEVAAGVYDCGDMIFIGDRR